MRNADKKHKIFQSAKKLILENGYCRTSVEHITNAVGIAKGSFYTYYKSKDDLLEELINSTIESRVEALRNIVESSNTLEEAIGNYIRERFSVDFERLENALVIVNLHRNIESLSPEIRRLLVSSEALNNEILNEIINKFKSKTVASDEEEIDRLVTFINGGIRVYRTSCFFYKNDTDFFINDINVVMARIEAMDIEKEIKLISDNIIRLLRGGKV